MKPKILKLSGLNSFVEEEVIEFNKLTEKGFFGIFGPTGSGKSSIFDAITLALYGSISRDTKEFINKEKEELYVSFQFSLAGKETYTVERKLGISDAGGYKTKNARLQLDNESEEIVILDKVTEINNKIEEIIGLNADDFMRTVVLPQGKFSKFLQLTGADRREMLERILNLGEYGEELDDNLKKVRKKRRKKQEELSIYLENYQEVTVEKIEEESEELKELESELKQVAAELAEKEKVHAEYKQVKELTAEFKKYQNQKDEMIGKEQEIDKLKDRLKLTQEANGLKNELNRRQELESNLIETEEKLKEVREEIKELQLKKIKQEEEFDKWETAREEEKPELNQKKYKLEDAIKIKAKVIEMEVDIKEKSETLTGLEENEKREKTELEALEANLAVVRENSAKFSEKLEEKQVSSALRELVNTGKEKEYKYQQVKSEIEKLNADVSATKERLESIKAEIEDLTKEKYNTEVKLLKDLIYQVSGTRKDITKYQNELNQLQKKLAVGEENLAFYLARNLEKSKVCPVCGSKDHPAPAINGQSDKGEDINIAQIDKEINSCQQEIKLLEQTLESLNQEKVKLTAEFNISEEELDKLEPAELQSKSRMESKRTKINNKIGQLQGKKSSQEEELANLQQKKGEKEVELASLKTSYDEALTDLEETDLNSEIFKKAEGEISKLDRDAEELKSQVEKALSKIEELENEKSEVKDSIAELGKNKLKLETELESVKESLSEKQVELKEKAGEEDPEEGLTEVKARINEIEEQYRSAQKALEKVKKSLNQQEKLEEKFADRQERYQDELKVLEAKLAEKIEESQLDSIEEAETYLEDIDKINKWEEKIDSYQEELRDLENNIDRVSKELNEREFSKGAWKDLNDQLDNLKEQRAKLQESIGGKKSELEKLEEDLKDKKEKEAVKKDLEHELDLIDQIYKLIKGKKFVEFVATRQLRYIAQEASKRLMEITNNRYKLELNSDIEFIICDLHNGGVRRDCNTLSGGETFLTSLSLALALSSHIQLKGGTDLGFFFLDEGFGTLDSGLLDVVMSSLEQLQDEEMAVGIISHVEELKERVPIKLLVEPAEPGLRGSSVQIEYS